MINKIAVLVDSGCDVPKNYLAQDNVFSVPLKLIYQDKQYLDGVDITGDDVLASLEKEVPKTSLPDGQMIQDTLEEIAKNFTHVIAITISSGLSGTFNALRLHLGNFPQLESTLIDTKNIGIAAGFQGIYACELIKEGLPFEKIVEKIKQSIPHTKVFFSVATLEYLQKGGRIGLVSALLGQALSLKPVISCNEEGIYYTVTKTRGLNKSREKLRKLITENIPSSGKFRLAVAQAGAKEAAQEAYDYLKEKFPQVEILMAPISPALSVHTGPGLLGLGIQVY